MYPQITTTVSNEYIVNQDWVAPGFDNVIQVGDVEALTGSAYVFNDKQVNNYVRLYIEHGKHDYFSTDKTYKITFQLKYWTYTVPFDPDVPPLLALLTEHTETKDLTVQYDADNSDAYNDIAEFRFSNAYKIKVTITGVDIDGSPVTTTTDIPTGLAMELGIEKERYYEFNPTDIAESMLVEWDADYNEIVIKNFTIDGANTYDVEWTYVNNYANSALVDALLAEELEFTFHNNSARVTLNSNQAIRIPAIFDRGYVICRVRGIGIDVYDMDLKRTITGQWNIEDNYDEGEAYLYHLDDISLPSGNPMIEIDNITVPIHESNKNWMYSVVFAEDGKMKHSIGYSDGTLRTRQQVSLANTEKEVIIGETFYDHQGRAVVQSMPVPPDPLEDESGDRIVKYREDFNLNEAGDKFSKADFDMDDEVDGCEAVIGKFNTESGTGRYYSIDNPIQAQFNAFIPDAGGYGYVLTELMPDGSGRISRQSMPGEAFKLDGEHVTTYLYGTPFQDELDRLFGSNVGFASHYKKNAIIDPNGQISVSYIDMKGNVIATALAGNGTVNTELIKNDDTGDYLYDEAIQTYTIDLLDQSVFDYKGGKNKPSEDGKSLTLSVPILVTSVSDYVFTYTIEGLEYMETCLEAYCLTCVYDLNIQLIDNCGNPVSDGTGALDFTLVIGDMPLWDGSDGSLNCVDENDFNSNTDYLNLFTIDDLPIGSYTLTKTLSINEEALDIYSVLYIENTAGCESTYEDFYNAEVSEISAEDCAIDCDYCAELPELSEYIELNATVEFPLPDEVAALTAAYNSIVEDCQTICAFPSNDFCGLGYNMMIQDILPGGQYAEYIDPQTGNINTSLFKLSILNSGNYFPDKTLNAVTKDPYWKNPYLFDYATNTWSEGFFEEDGITRSIISLTLDADDNPNVDCINQHIAPDGSVFCYPEELTNVNDFIDYYKMNPSWANSLVAYHPEWFYFEHCSKLYEATTAAAIGGVFYDPFEFDVYLFDHAYLDGTWDDYINPEDADPFFNDLVVEGIDLDESEMTNRLENLFECETEVFTAWQFAWIQSHLGNEIYEMDCSDIEAELPVVVGNEDYITDYNTWVAFLGIYMGIKHDIWQEAASVYVDNERQGYNGCIGMDYYNYDYSLESLSTEVANIEALLEGGYICGIPTGPLLVDKIARFADPEIVFNLSTESDISETMTAVYEAYDEADLAYFEQTGNPAMAFDLQNFINGWQNQDVLDEVVGTPMDVTENDLLTYRLWQIFDANSYNDWDPVLDMSGTTMSWTPSGAPSPCLTITIPSGTFDEILGFSDIHIIDETNFEISATIYNPDPLVGPGTTMEMLCTGTSNCIPIDDYSFIYSTCNITEEATAIWTIMNIELAEAGGEFFNDEYVEIEESASFSYLLRDYLGEATPYRWRMESSTAFTLSSKVDDGRFIRIHFNEELVSDPSVEYIDIITSLALPDYTGPNTNFNMHFESMDENRTGYIDWHWGTSTYTFPVSTCDYSFELACNDEEHYNLEDMEILLTKLVDEGGFELTAGGYIDLEVLTEYTDRLELLTGSPVTNERWRVIENSETHFEAAISSFVDGIYTDNCMIEFTIYDPLVIDAFAFEDAVSGGDLFGDFTTAYGMESTYDFTFNFTDAGFDTYTIKGTSCIPLKNCSGCESVNPGTNSGTYAHITAEIKGVEGYSVPVLVVTGYHTGLSDDELIFEIPESPFIPDFINLEFSSSLGTAVIEIENVNGAFGETFLLGSYFSDILDYTVGAFGAGGPPYYWVLRFNSGEMIIEPDLEALSPECFPDITIPNMPEIVFTSDCYLNLIATAAATALEDYNLYLEEVHDNFEAAYVQHCMTAATDFLETFTMTYDAAEYQYTLYYYDQAGNLVATVPPEGVEFVAETEYDNIDAYRKEIAYVDPVPALHTLPTLYAYNGLNQLKWQKTPDAGISEFWYDWLGRLVFSQNAKQDATIVETDVKYSYSKYDPLGRIFEVGQVTAAQDVEDNELFYGWINDMENFPTNFGYGREEVTISIYDIAPELTLDPPFGVEGQQNLWKRVSSVFYFDTYDGALENVSDEPLYSHATHFSYDIYGNVHTLIQDNPTIATLGEQFKKVEYDYDIISGNVNKVSYQAGDVDEFYHWYRYDADNRLEKVATSADGFILEREAIYRYYRHGPLARVEIGDLKVQGIDYAYNLNGWLKGVNAGAINNARDMGKDGKTGANPNQYTSADAFGFVLHYFDGDYARINSSVNDFVPSYSGSAFYGASDDMYNGNIKAMVTALRKTDGTAAPVLGKAYGYDQLNRIERSISFEKSNMHSTGEFTWTSISSTNKWGTSYEYDGNGNITKMNRAGNLGGAYDMDQFDYHYDYGNNQLSYVSDNTSLSGNYSDDIDNQTSTTNYAYDEIGNLISDEAGGIESIEWTVAGKIKSIDKSSGPDLEFAYDAMGNRIMKKVTPATGDIIVTYYVRDATGNVLAVYTRTIGGATDVISLSEQHIYGASRLGYRKKTIAMTSSLPTNGIYSRYLGDKHYELVNHLGNVLAVITDRHTGVESTGDAFADWFKPDVVSAMDYDPFGMLLSGRSWEAGSGYRYGFNSQEQDDEVYGNGNLNTAEYWAYDSRIGRRWNLDPVVRFWLSGYSTFSCNPIIFVDPNGNSDYYNQKGKYLGSDGTNGTDIFIVTDKSVAKSIWKQTKSNIKKDGYSVYQGEVAAGTFFVLPPKNHRDAIKEIMQADNGNGYSEYGGRGLKGNADKSGNFIHARSEDGTPAGPDDDKAEIFLSKIFGGVGGEEYNNVINNVGFDYTVVYKWHSHPGGAWIREITDGLLGPWMTISEYTMKNHDPLGPIRIQSAPTEEKTFGVGPSQHDLNVAANSDVDNFVINVKFRSVFYYNKDTNKGLGDSGRISLDNFYNLEAKQIPE